jgi:hypothetical protein
MQYEPKRPNRFIAVFDEELGIEIWSVQKFKRPQLKINPVEIKYMNTSNWVAGNYTWQPIEITFLDLIGPSTSQKLMEWVRLHVESISGKEGYAAGYKKTIVLKQLESLTKSADYTQELLRAGEANYTEVLNAQKDLLAAQLSKTNDKLDQLTQSVNLYKALGGGIQ